MGVVDDGDYLNDLPTEAKADDGMRGGKEMGKAAIYTNPRGAMTVRKGSLFSHCLIRQRRCDVLSTTRYSVSRRLVTRTIANSRD